MHPFEIVAEFRVQLFTRLEDESAEGRPAQFAVDEPKRILVPMPSVKLAGREQLKWDPHSGHDDRADYD
ncbi:MAG TPA: hypothetical protein VG758_20430 [Hyphomicrobiaceae bacterium]|nr:hypothetical protein [Hyphomicrobiaceae bacterium]